MRQQWLALLPIWKTLFACLAMEIFLFAILFLLTRSTIASMLMQVVVFGPPTLFFAPYLYKKYTKQMVRQLANERE